jgi:hypothetical protein
LGGYWIKADGLLFETDVVQRWKTWFLDLIADFDRDSPVNGSRKDLLSMVFFCISRYEAYLPFKPDKHGRISLAESVMRFFGDSLTPIVDLIIENIGKYLRPQDPISLIEQRHSVQMISTIDVDFPWLLLHRKWLFKTLFLFKRRRQEPSKGYWEKILKGRVRDPFDQFEYLRQLHEKSGLKPIFFWLNAKKISKYDRTAIYKRNHLSTLIKEVDTWSETGIHPSYFTRERPGRYRAEMAEFKDLIGRDVYMQRTHFLRMKWPESLRIAAGIGITADFSTAFADAPGFPLGTTVPVNFFDLIENKRYDLLIYSTNIMDVTLKQYLGLSPEEAVEKSTRIIRMVKRYKGVFVLLWHNSSLSEINGWSGWKDAYEKILKQGLDELMPNSLP